MTVKFPQYYFNQQRVFITSHLINFSPDKPANGYAHLNFEFGEDFLRCDNSMDLFHGTLTEFCVFQYNRELEPKREKENLSSYHRLKKILNFLHSFWQP